MPGPGSLSARSRVGKGVTDNARLTDKKLERSGRLGEKSRATVTASYEPASRRGQLLPSIAANALRRIRRLKAARDGQGRCTIVFADHSQPQVQMATAVSESAKSRELPRSG